MLQYHVNGQMGMKLPLKNRLCMRWMHNGTGNCVNIRTIFDVVVDQQGMNEVKEQLYNPYNLPDYEQ